MFSNREEKMKRDNELLARWGWMLEDISGSEKLVTATVLENSYQECVNTGQITEGWLESMLSEQELNEAPQTTSSSWASGTTLVPKVLFPMIKRVMPNLFANKIVSVQPITQRTGVIYYMTYQFTNSKGEIVANDEYSGVPQQGLPGYAQTYSQEKFGPFYITLSSADGSASTLNRSSIDYFSFLTNTVDFSSKVKRVEVYSKEDQSATFLEASAFQYENSGSLSWASTSKKVAYMGPSSAAANTLVLRQGSNGFADGDYVVFVSYNQEGSSDLPEMEFTIGSKSVDTTERKLKVRWTKEAEQDVKAYHQIDVENELVKMASMEMNYEVDREILQFVGDSVTSSLSFLHDWTNDAPGAGNNSSGNYLDRHRALAQKIYQVQAKIAQYNRQGPASWGVVSPQIAAILSMLPDFKGEIAGGTFNVFSAGQLGNGLELYVDPNRQGTISGEVLMGYKSRESQYGAGIVYSPYVNWMSDVVTHPDNFNSIRGFFSRYALTLVPRGQWNYGKLNILNAEI